MQSWSSVALFSHLINTAAAAAVAAVEQDSAPSCPAVALDPTFPSFQQPLFVHRSPPHDAFPLLSSDPFPEPCSGAPVAEICWSIASHDAGLVSHALHLAEPGYLEEHLCGVDDEKDRT